MMLFAKIATLTLIAVACQAQTHPGEWPNYGNDPGGMRYSPLKQISLDNVSKLEVAWVYRTGDVSDGSQGRRRSGFETTPIMVDGTLYLTTAFNRVIAIDPATGKERWAHDPKIEQKWEYGDGLINRGVATWLDPSRTAQQPCRRRLFESTLDARLIAVDAATGKACADFGAEGQVNLRDVPGYRQGWYHMTSPPAVVDDVVVVGSAIDDNPRVDMPAGVVRAFDVHTGAMLWSWDPIPRNGSDPKWRSGAGNAWSIMAVDPERHLVFVPTGSASPDYYGGLRPGDDKWANSVVALRARTGEVAWGFQLVHHDLWDYDSASPPLLATITRDGAKIPVVIQGNKTGFLYVLHRDTGKPVFPVEERSVPQTDIPGETTSPTQPFPSAPPPLTRQRLAEDELWGLTEADREACRTALRGMRNEGIFTPPSLQGTLTVPGVIGGLNWSGTAFDPQRGVLIVNTANFPFKVRLIPTEKWRDPKVRSEDGAYTPQTGAPYGMFRAPFYSPSHLPCTPPPWGMLAAVDLSKGTIRWQVPLGSMQGFIPGSAPIPPGSITLGGAIVTASGLAFIAGTFDPYLRAFDVETGKEVWKAKLPFSGHATPMTYQAANGKQYVVIAAGGHQAIHEEPLGDALVAFALP